MFFSSKKILIDTGFIVALFNEKDQYHLSAQETAKRIAFLEWNTTSFVIQEIFWLISKRKNFNSACTFFQKIPSLFSLPPLPRNWSDRISEILFQYSSLDIDLADASLIVLADHLKTPQIVSVDRKDFSILRWNGNRNTFHNMMEK